MIKTVKLRDEDYQDQTYTVQNGVKIPLADGSGMATAYFAEGTLPITANGSYDVRDKASVAVNVPTGGGANAALIGLLDGSITQLTAQDLAGLTELRESGLYALQNLVSVTFPSGLRVIDYNAVADCPSLRSVNFPSTPLIIGEMAFSQCSALVSVVWGSGITDIFNGAFFYCRSLTVVDLPAIISVGNGAFTGCSALETVRLGSTCTSIGDQAFSDCSALTTLTVEATAPPTLISDALSGCTSLTAIYVPVESVSAYKTASGWSQYASIIQAIPT